MNLSSIEAVLLFTLSLPLVFKYRILPVTGTSYLYFSLYFLLNIINIYISRIKLILNPQKANNLKWFLTITIISISLFGLIWTAIIDRGRTAPGANYGTHDIILQLESALTFLSQNKNPYKETYFGTPLESWNYEESGQKAVNPALYHFVMPPWYLLFSYPFYFVFQRTLGFFDGRIPLLFLAISLTAVIYLWFRNNSNGRLLLILLLLNPASVDYLIEGRSDLFVVSFLILSLFLLEKKRFVISSIIMGMAMVSKQSAWFILPFYLCGVYNLNNKSIKSTIKLTVILVLTAFLISIPFLILDLRAFINSTVFYLSGNAQNSYPVSGYGLSMILYQMGIVKSLHAAYPFLIWQVIFGIPSIVIGCGFLIKKFSVSRMVFAYATALFLIWYVSRYFNNSHMAYISGLFILSALTDNNFNKRIS